MVKDWTVIIQAFLTATCGLRLVVFVAYCTCFSSSPRGGLPDNGIKLRLVWRKKLILTSCRFSGGLFNSRHYVVDCSKTRKMDVFILFRFTFFSFLKKELDPLHRRIPPVDSNRGRGIGFGEIYSKLRLLSCLDQLLILEVKNIWTRDEPPRVHH